MSRTCTYLVGILVCLGFHNKISQTKWLKQQMFIFSQFWMLEIQDQGAGMFGVW